MTMPEALPGCASRLRPWIDHLEAGLLERATAVRLLLLAALAGEHVLLIGPPGTAKSELARRLHRAFAESPYFERLLTRFSTPEELFGPLSLKALEEDRYERLTRGFLPEAGLAFLDEVFKANSAILNALLTLLNEREFDNGSGRMHTPLVSVIGASNEGPLDEGLQAFYDRFLVRIPVGPVSDEAFPDLLALPSVAAVAALPVALAPAERQALREQAAQVALSDEAVQACAALRGFLAGQGRALSDRRWRQWVGLMRLAAASEGRAEVDAPDLWLAPYVAAQQPGDVTALRAWFVDRLLQAAPQPAEWLTRAVQAFEHQLEVEQSARDDPEAANAAGKLALARAIGMADPGAEAGSATAAAASTRLLSAALEDAQRRRYSPVHVAARVQQVNELRQQVQAAHDLTAAFHADLAMRLNARLWWPPELLGTVLAGPLDTTARLAGLRDRLAAVAQSFAHLPLREPQDLDDTTPEPVAWDALVA